MTRNALRTRRAALALLLLVTQCTLADGAATGDGGLRVDVQLASREMPAAVWSTDRGDTITLSRGYVAIRSVEIVACSGQLAAVRPVFDLGIGLAHAHSTTSPRKLGVPGVAPLAPAEPTRAALGSLGPPPARYCEVRVVLGAADGDAVMLPHDVAMVGRTLVLEGTLEGDEGSLEPFRVESQGSLEVVREVSFELSEEGVQEAELSIEIDATALFAGIDRDAVLDVRAGDAALANVSAGLRVSTR